MKKEPLLEVFLIFGVFATLYTSFSMIGFYDFSSSPKSCIISSAIREDVNENYQVDLSDLVLVAKKFGYGSQALNCPIREDVNENYQVEIGDLIRIAKKFNYEYDPIFHSPVKLLAQINRQNPASTISNAELEMLGEKADLIAGLDGHGYEFPGAIARFREKNLITKVLCYGNTMDIIPSDNDERTKIIDKEEDSFFHTSDPASLRIISFNGETRLWFKQDARARKAMPYYTQPGVEKYEIEYSDSENGPWNYLGEVAEDGAGHLAVNIGIPVYTFVDPNPSIQKWYRVKTKLYTETSPVDYSWAAQAENTLSAFPIAHLTPDGIFSILFVGNDAPSPSEVIFERDINNNRIFEADERTPATDVITRPIYSIYYGTIPATNRVSYHAFLSTNPSVQVPLNGDSYTAQNGYNNRIQNSFGSHIIKPNSPIWKNILLTRLENCSKHGYNGIRLDFAYDNIELNWISNGRVSSRERQIHNNLSVHVKNLLTEIKSANPNNHITINGFFVLGNKNNFLNYLSAVDGADFEYFAYDSPDTVELMPSISEAMIGILQAQQVGKIPIALTNTGENNRLARINSLVLYLLVANEKTYFWSTGGDGAYQSIPYFPEYDVPLGKPIIPQITSIPLLSDSSGMLVREFENGFAYFNPSSEPITKELDGTYNLASLSGGYDPIVGGDGTVSYTDITSLTLESKQAAILIRNLT